MVSDLESDSLSLTVEVFLIAFFFLGTHLRSNSKYLTNFKNTTLFYQY
jgi:hypothetical protein